jgi:hypothetical protein
MLRVFFNPPADFLIGCAGRHQVTELAALDPGLLEKVLVHWTAKLEITIPTHQRRSAFVETAGRMRLAAQLLMRRPGFFFAQIARKFSDPFQVFHFASCPKVRRIPRKANGQLG